MRILQVIPTLGADGAQRMVANLCRHLRDSGHEVGVASLFDPSGLSVEGELRSHGVELFLLGKKMGVDLRMVPRLASARARFRPDVIHTHMYVLKYLLPGLLASRRCPIVHTVHNLAECEGTRGDDIVQHFAFRLGVAAVAIGDAVAESVRRHYRLPPRRIIPNGIPVARYAPPGGAREAVRAALGIPAEVPVFVMVGRFVEQKNHAAVLAAFASPRLSALAPHLLLAGDGVLRGELERQAAALGIAERVHFLGARKDVPRVLAAADVFVLSSLYEGHPLAVMEAMAAGKPVVATAVGCVPEAVSDGTGRLVAPRDAGALEAALYELASDLEMARSLGAAALRAARERFDASLMARAYEQLYDEMLATRAVFLRASSPP
jgi:glycosyltransferase involved in cell wall biosynthesis